jgi:hypothetical protein
VTVNFKLDGLDITASGVKHATGFDVHSVHLQGLAADLRKKLDADFLDQIAEAARWADEDGNIPFAEPKPAPTVAVLDVAGKRLVDLSIELAEGGTA